LELPRLALEAPPIADDENFYLLQRRLAEKAKNLLGYGLLKDHSDSVVAQAKKRTSFVEFAHAMKDLAIKPFAAKAVLKYERRQRRRMNLKSFFSLSWGTQCYCLIDRLASKMHAALGGRPNAQNIDWRVVIVGLGPFVLAVIDVILWRCGWMILGGLLSPFILISLGWLYNIAMTERMQNRTLETWNWENLTFPECHERGIEIPLFALDTATKVKERVPEVEPFIRALVSKQLTIGDPFLYLRFDGAEYAVEVFEEPRFETKFVHRGQ
jgi:hypothetical protein